MTGRYAIIYLSIVCGSEGPVLLSVTAKKWLQGKIFPGSSAGSAIVVLYGLLPDVPILNVAVVVLATVVVWVGSVVVDFAIAIPMMGVLTVGTVLLFTVLRTDLTLTDLEAYTLLAAYLLFVVWIAAETAGLTDLIQGVWEVPSQSSATAGRSTSRSSSSPSMS